MKKLPWWTWALIVLIAADLGLAATGTGVLMAEQHGHGWKMDSAGKQKIPVLGCIYWTGLRTRLKATPEPAPDQRCAVIDR